MFWFLRSRFCFTVCSWLTIILLLVYTGLVIVVLLNVLIAQLSYTYSEAKNNAKLQYSIDRMSIIARLEQWPYPFVSISKCVFHVQNNVHLMFFLLGNREVFFPQASMFSETSRGKHWDLRGNKTHYFPRKSTSSVFMCGNMNKTKKTIFTRSFNFTNFLLGMK